MLSSSMNLELSHKPSMPRLSTVMKMPKIREIFKKISILEEKSREAKIADNNRILNSTKIRKLFINI